MYSDLGGEATESPRRNVVRKAKKKERRDPQQVRRPSNGRQTLPVSADAKSPMPSKQQLWKKSGLGVDSEQVEASHHNRAQKSDVFMQLDGKCVSMVSRDGRCVGMVIIHS